MYADLRNDGDGLGEGEVVVRGQVEVRADAKKLVCGDEVGKKDKHSITVETWSTSGKGKSGKGKRM